MTNQPAFNASTMLLLTDGSVMCQNLSANDWHRLTPDDHGSYVNGTWTPLPSTTHAPLYYASAVLRDGRVFRAGGEYDGPSDIEVELNVAEIFDPAKNVWQPIASPPGVKLGDAVSCVLTNGNVLVGTLGGAPTVYDPIANTWTPTGPKANGTSHEETWTLLADGTVLTLDCFGHPQAEKYIPATNSWITIGNTPQDLVFDVPHEIGPALRLPDGRVFCVGGTNKTALYTPGPTPTAPGTFVAGPTLPPIGGKQLGAADAPGVLLPNGKVLFAVAPADNAKDSYYPPTYLFEYDPATNTVAQIAGPPNADLPTYTSRMLLLPSGQVLFANSTDYVAVYTPSGGPQSGWRPVITSVPNALQAGHTYLLQGRQLNGLSQACSYGDDAQMATNYPIVRLEYQDGEVVYCRTFNHSTMGIATGSAVVTTHFTVPLSAPGGTPKLVVIANGIPSAPVVVTVTPFAFLKPDIVLKWVEELFYRPHEDDDTFVRQELHNVLTRIATQVDVLGAAVQQHTAFIGAQLRPTVGAVPAPQLTPPARHGAAPQESEHAQA